MDEYYDVELAQLACQGEKAAWDRLYERHYDFLWSFACAHLKLPAELSRSKKLGVEVTAITAEEFVHEVYMIVWTKKKCCSYRGRGSFRSWYKTVAGTIHSDLYRQKRQQNPPGLRVPIEDEDEEDG